MNESTDDYFSAFLEAEPSQDDGTAAEVSDEYVEVDWSPSPESWSNASAWEQAVQDEEATSSTFTSMSQLAAETSSDPADLHHEGELSASAIAISAGKDVTIHSRPAHQHNDRKTEIDLRERFKCLQLPIFIFVGAH